MIVGAKNQKHRIGKKKMFPSKSKWYYDEIYKFKPYGKHELRG